MKRAITVLVMLLLIASPSSSHSFWQTVYSTSVSTDSVNGTPTSITGLAFPVATSTKYVFHCYFVSKSAAATTAILYSLTGPAVSVATFKLVTQNAAGPPATTLTEFFTGATVAFTSAATDSVTTDHIDELIGSFTTSAAGTIQFKVDSEIAGPSTVTVELGSWCEFMNPRPSITYSPLG